MKRRRGYLYFAFFSELVSSSGRGQWPCPDVTNAPGNRSPLPQYTRSTNTKGLFINDVIIFGISPLSSCHPLATQNKKLYTGSLMIIRFSVQMLFFVFKFDMTFECV